MSFYKKVGSVSILFLLLLSYTNFTTLEALPSLTDGLQGFGAKATGGGSDPNNICLVTNLLDDATKTGTLRSCLNRPGPVRVKFNLDGRIILKEPLKPHAHSTIDGRGRRIVLSIQKQTAILIQASNVIVGDLVFENTLPVGDTCASPVDPKSVSKCGIGISIKGSVRDIWIHHNSFSNCGEKCVVSGYDGNDGLPSFISLSHNRFLNSYYAVLFEAVPNSATQAPQVTNVSIYNNLFAKIFRRSPRLSGHVRGHIFNNVVQDWGGILEGACDGFATSSVGEALALLENNVYLPSIDSPCKAAAEVSEYSKFGVNLDFGRIRAVGNLLLRESTLEESSPSKVPNAPYTYSLNSTDFVWHNVREQSGPRR